MPVTKPSGADWSAGASTPSNDEAQQIAEQIADFEAGDYGAGFFDYGPMTAPQPASPYQGAIDAADTALANLAAQQYGSEQRQRRFADRAAIQDALALQRQQQALAQQGAEAFRAQEAALAMGMPQRQAGFDAYQAQLQDAANIARAQAAASQPMFPGLGGVLAGGLGGFMNRRIADQLEAAATRERFLGDRRLTEPVYGTTGRVTGVYDPYRRLTGRDPIAEAEQAERMRMAEAGQPEVVAPVQDPATGQQRCPDGYIFDEDLNACRLAPMQRTVADTTPGEAYARTGLLDVAPEGLLEFQQRYGAGFGSPMEFGAANLAFRRQGATYPEYFSTAPKLDGYTLLS
jgi:hypothetical protein